MSSHLKLALRFKTQIGEPRVAGLYLNIWSSVGGIGGTYWSSSPWVGTLFNGTVDDVDWWTPSKGIYIKNDTDGIVAVVRAVSPWEKFGDTGAGRLYNGCSGTYPVPFDFDWECIATGRGCSQADDHRPGTSRTRNGRRNRAVHETVTAAPSRILGY